jgi:hypothetical protein
MENKISVIIENIQDRINVDEYEIISSQAWNPLESAPSVFVDLFYLFCYLNVNISFIDFKLLEFACVDSIKNDENELYYICNIRNVIQYLIRNGFYTL